MTDLDVRAGQRTDATSRATSRASTRLASVPSWGLVLVIYGASRALTTGILAIVYWLATLNHWPFASYATKPNFIGFMDSWDGKFYRQIALVGYPTTLPLDSQGHVLPNAWAFLPVYPWLTRGLMTVTGLSFSVAGVAISMIFGALAALLLYRIVLGRVGHAAALWSVAFFCVGPLSFILQATYAESLFLVLMFASLLALLARRYLLMIPFAVVAAFTHPGELALAAALGILFVVGLVRRDPVPVAERVRMAAAGVVIAVAGFAWPPIVGFISGYRSAYFDTELAWWTGYVGRTHFVPFTPWFVMADRYLGMIGIPLVIVVVLAFGLWLVSRPMRVLGDDILAFSGSYAAYLVAVFLPQQSLIRLLLPLSPLLGAPVFTRSPRRAVVVLALLIASQPLLIITMWFLGPP